MARTRRIAPGVATMALRDTTALMNIRPIRTEADYRAALGDIAALMESDRVPGTPSGDRLDILATLVQAYEARHFPIDAIGPVQD